MGFCKGCQAGRKAAGFAQRPESQISINIAVPPNGIAFQHQRRGGTEIKRSPTSGRAASVGVTRSVRRQARWICGGASFSKNKQNSGDWAGDVLAPIRVRETWPGRRLGSGLMKDGGGRWQLPVAA